MARKIFKYHLSDQHGYPETFFDLELPKGAVVRHFSYDGHCRPCIWAEVDPDSPAVKRNFQIVGTGWDVPSGVYCGTMISTEGFVWHLYEIPRG